MMNIHNGVHFETAHILNRVSKSKTDGHIKLCCVRIPCNYWNRFESAWSISHAWLGISQYGMNSSHCCYQDEFRLFCIMVYIHLKYNSFDALLSFKRIYLIIIICDQIHTLWTKRAFMKMNFRLNFNGWSVYTIH